MRVPVASILQAGFAGGAGFGGLDDGSRRGHREATRQQVVTGEAGLDVLDIADLRGAGDVFEEYDFHEMLLTKERRLRVPGLVAEETGQTPTP